MTDQPRPAMAGYRALDLSDPKGFLCGMVLAYLGVDVIKVEPPGGDRARERGPFIDDIPHPDRSLSRIAYNAGKRSITLNLETESGRTIFRRLVQQSDFLIESFDPGYLAGLGLGYETLRELNPRLVMAAITPFGQTGPYANYRADNLVSLAMGGLLYITGDPHGPPVQLGGEQAYIQTGLNASAACMVAHDYRQRTGEGQLLDVSVHASVFRTSYILVPDWEYAGKIEMRLGNRVYRSGIYQREMWPCQDGYVAWRFFVGSAGIDEWRKFIEWLDEEGMVGTLRDFDFMTETTTNIRQERIDDVERQIGEFFLRRTKDEIEKQALRHGVRLLKVSTVADVIASEQLEARHFWQRVSYPQTPAPVPHPAFLYRSSERATALPRRAPLIGEHNRAVYVDELGYSPADLRVFAEAGVV